MNLFVFNIVDMEGKMKFNIKWEMFLEKFRTTYICMAEIHYTKETHHMANFNILLTGHNNLFVFNVYS